MRHEALAAFEDSVSSVWGSCCCQSSELADRKSALTAVWLLPNPYCQYCRHLPIYTGSHAECRCRIGSLIRVDTVIDSQQIWLIQRMCSVHQLLCWPNWTSWNCCNFVLICSLQSVTGHHHLIHSCQALASLFALKLGINKGQYCMFLSLVAMRLPNVLLLVVIYRLLANDQSICCW